METGPQLAVYRRCPQVVDTRYSHESDETLVVTLTDAIARAEGIDPLELPSLYEHIDGEALSDFVANGTQTGNDQMFVGFTYENWNVFVRADGHIRVCDGSKSIDPEPIFA